MYMSPERFQGERYDYASDVWSMGVIALEALTGVHPYASKKTFLSLSLAICKDPPPPPPEGTPPEVAEVIGACLRKEPSGKEGRPKVRELMVSAWPPSRPPSLTVARPPSPSLTLPHRRSPSLTVAHPPSPSLTLPHLLQVRELMVSAWLQPHSAGSPEAATLAYLREIGLVAPAVA